MLFVSSVIIIIFALFCSVFLWLGVVVSHQAAAHQSQPATPSLHPPPVKFVYLCLCLFLFFIVYPYRKSIEYFKNAILYIKVEACRNNQTKRQGQQAHGSYHDGNKSIGNVFHFLPYSFTSSISQQI